MPRLELHQLPGQKRAAEVTRCVEGLYRDGRRVVIWVGDRGRLKVLDDYLWTYEKLSFMPHAVWVAEGVTDEPVILTSDPVDIDGVDVLVVGDGLPPADWIAGFAEVHDFVSPGGDGEERVQFWQRCREAGAVEAIGS